MATKVKWTDAEMSLIKHCLCSTRSLAEAVDMFFTNCNTAERTKSAIRKKFKRYLIESYEAPTCTCIENPEKEAEETGVVVEPVVEPGLENANPVEEKPEKTDTGFLHRIKMWFCSLF